MRDEFPGSTETSYPLATLVPPMGPMIERMGTHAARHAPPVPSPLALLAARLGVRAFGIVVPGLLYRSGQVQRRWAEGSFRRLRLRRIVNLTSEGYGNRHKDAERAAATRLGIERRTFHLYGDGTGDPTLYRDALACVHASLLRGEPVLVHCAAGAYRTGALVAWYRMLVQGWPRAAAVREMERFGVGGEGRERLVAFLDEHAAFVATALPPATGLLAPPFAKVVDARAA